MQTAALFIAPCLRLPRVLGFCFPPVKRQPLSQHPAPASGDRSVTRPLSLSLSLSLSLISLSSLSLTSRSLVHRLLPAPPTLTTRLPLPGRDSTPATPLSLSLSLSPSSLSHPFPS